MIKRQEIRESGNSNFKVTLQRKNVVHSHNYNDLDGCNSAVHL